VGVDKSISPPRWWVWLVAAIVLGTASVVAIAAERGPEHSAASFIDGRREPGRFLFDYTGDLEHYEEGVQLFLRTMRERFHIDAVIATLPALPENTYLEELAVELVDRWRIGAEHQGRGLLLLLVKQDKQVKLEVTYELEDIFTDAFTSYIEDLQLLPNYRNGDTGTGLVAVMEEIEERAQVEQLGSYSPTGIIQLDEQLLSGGAGAKKYLPRSEGDAQDPVTAADAPARGARTPQEAWEIMVAKWAGQGADMHVDVYTEMTKLAMGDPDRPDARTRHSVRHWRNARYEVRQDDRHAVIWFGNIPGWDNAPFLFCRTPTGWKFDIVHQRRLVVMGQSPTWMIERGDYPYIALLLDAPKSRGKDFALPAEDHYSCQDDVEIAEQIRKLEEQCRQSPDDIEVLTRLLRLNVITGRRPHHVIPLLKQLEKLSPRNPDLHKYAAIYHVHSFFQYGTALEHMKVYRKLRPEDPFSQDFIRFLEQRAAR
jgi:hypothetical protein